MKIYPDGRDPFAITPYAAVLLTCLAAPPLLAMPVVKDAGWVLLFFAAMMSLYFNKLRPTPLGRHLLIIIAMLALLGLIPIDTTITYSHMFSMGAVLAATILVPYFISKWWLPNHPITFPFRTGRKWYRKEIAYIAFAGVASYLIIPYYLGSTGSYLNWDVVLDPSHIARLFIGTNALGIWDELFFVGVCLALLRTYIPFIWANLAQATMWTAFLYELGFRGWGPVAVFFFAISQGIVFKNTKSLLYIITIHLTIDLVLFLALIHLHHPQYLDIFITAPF
jgi:hypothetical protein